MSDETRFPELQLDFVESRVLGCLLEKETTTPDYYPMTAKAIEAASNQSSNRYPVTHLVAEEVEEAVQRLRRKNLIMQVHISGSRVPKYEHQLPEILDMTSAENAIITTLLLRSIQTAGEIKQRTERMHPFESVTQVEEILSGFMEYSYGPLVKELPVGGGRRVKTYGHLLGGEKGFEADVRFENTPAAPPSPDLEERVAELEKKVALLMEQLGLEEEVTKIE
ncbi:MAG: hypothetical protein ACI9NQ_001885 [Paracoccaceae bacterium]|jgi:uncharacterized protein YceH (UPF0502 family)